MRAALRRGGRAAGGGRGWGRRRQSEPQRHSHRGVGGGLSPGLGHAEGGGLSRAFGPALLGLLGVLRQEKPRPRGGGVTRAGGVVVLHGAGEGVGGPGVEAGAMLDPGRIAPGPARRDLVVERDVGALRQGVVRPARRLRILRRFPLAGRRRGAVTLSPPQRLGHRLELGDLGKPCLRQRAPVGGQVNWPPFRPDTRLRQGGLGISPGTAYVGRLSEDRGHHRAARRRRWTIEEKLRIVEETLRSGESISILARRHGVAPNLLYRWRRLMTEGGAVAVQADDAVTGNAELRRLEDRMREFERQLGRKTLEVEILKEALARSRTKKPMRGRERSGQCRARGLELALSESPIRGIDESSGLIRSGRAAVARARRRLVMLAGGVLAWLVQTAGGVRVLDVRFAGTGGVAMSALLFIPPNATPKTPAPGVMAVHGYFNSRETQGDFAIEFARRGYVVLALDQVGHGYSDPPAFVHGFGGPDGLRYLRSLDFVDKDNIGLEGHSMGGWAVVNAASAFPDGYKALVLEGSEHRRAVRAGGHAAFPRNLAVVFARYDEFSPVMWGVPTARGVADSLKLWKPFGTQGPVEPGKLYGSIADGTGACCTRRAARIPGITSRRRPSAMPSIGSSAR